MQSTLVTVVHHHDDHHAFLTPPEERIANLIDGAVDHFRLLPGNYTLVLCENGDRLHPDVTLGAIHYEPGKNHDLRIVEADDA